MSREERVQTEGVRPDVSTPLPWVFGHNQGEIFSPATGRTICVLPVFLGTDAKRNAEYITHAANALPAVEAQLAEAVELLERWSKWLHSAPGELEIPASCALEVIKIRDDARAFLAKQPTEAR